MRLPQLSLAETTAIHFAKEIRQAPDDETAVAIILRGLFDCNQVTCDHCHITFWTGQMTGRRSHAQFCSDRCRVAAARARKND